MSEMTILSIDAHTVQFIVLGVIAVIALLYYGVPKLAETIRDSRKSNDKKDANKVAKLGFILSLTGFVLMLIPVWVGHIFWFIQIIILIILAICAFIYCYAGIKSEKKALAITGLILSAIVTIVIIMNVCSFIKLL
jgi:hypothetical protein